MKALLADAVFFATFAIAPALLLIRFFRPRILPRWLLMGLTVIVGSTAYYVSELLTYADWLQRIGPIAHPMPDNLEGMVVLGGPGRTEFMIGALLQLCYLLLCLVPYGITRVILDRRRQAHRVAV